MVIAYNRNRLGVGFVVSLVAHLAILLFIAAISSVNIKPVVPESKKIIVEIFDGTSEKKDEVPVKDVKRLGRETNRAIKETAPPPSPSSQAAISKPLLAVQRHSENAKPESIGKQAASAESQRPFAKDLRNNATGQAKAPLMQEGLRKKTTTEDEKKLPTLNALMPTYERLAMQYPSADTPRHVETGDAVSLNTTEFKYVSYFSKIKRQIQMVWKYPESARREGIMGVLTLKFSIKEDGNLKGVSLLRSSGSSILDRAAMEAVRDAVPFFPLPENLGEVLDVVANFEYELNGYYFR